MSEQPETHDADCEMYLEGCGCESREKLKKECDALRATLSRVADIAHAGGLISSDWLGFEVAIRRLTLTYFDRSGTIDNIKARAQAAIDAAREGK